MMQKRHDLRAGWRLALVLLAGVLALLLPASPVAANAPPPIHLLWLHFADSDAALSRVGIQLVRCNNQACEQPELIQQYGRCDAPGCLPVTAPLAAYATFECRAERCVQSIDGLYGYGRSASPHLLRLIVQYPDQVRMSTVFAVVNEGRLLSRFEAAFRVTVSDDALLVEPLPPDANKQPAWVPALLLTLALELGVALVVLGRLGLPTRERRILLGIIGLVNLFSFPVVWLFFPALGVFQTSADRTVGTITLLLALFYGGVLGGIRWIKPVLQRWLLSGLSLGCLPIALVPSLFIALSGYTRRVPHADGLPAPLPLVLSELFAFLFEAVVLYWASRRAVPFQSMLLLSLAMNGASLLGGVLLWLLLGGLGF